MNGKLLALIPFLPSFYIIVRLIFLVNPFDVIIKFISNFANQHFLTHDDGSSETIGKYSPIAPPVGSRLLVYVLIAILGYWGTDHLIPKIKVRYQNMRSNHIYLADEFIAYSTDCCRIFIFPLTNADIHS